MMRIIKSFIIAFSMYSKIPMPRAEWKEEDMKYVFCFFPFVGAVIGVLIFGWNCLCLRFELPEICRILITAAIPVIVTGGIHVDGFMDVCDALCSYKDKEEKLKILKDPHIGAFSVIMLALYGLLFVSALSFITDLKAVIVLALSFVLSRTLSSLAAVNLKKAKEGTLNTFSKSSAKVVVNVFVIMEMLVVFAGLFLVDPVACLVQFLCAALSFTFYYFKTKKEFGGVTGDTAGYFVLITEIVCLIGLAVCSFFKIWG